MVLLWDNKEQTKEPGFCYLTWAHPSFPKRKTTMQQQVMTPTGRMRPTPPTRPTSLTCKAQRQAVVRGPEKG